MLGFGGIVNVAPHFSTARRAILAHRAASSPSRFASGPKWLICGPSPVSASLHSLAHLGPVEAVEGIALDDLGIDFFAPEDVCEALHDGGGSRTGGAGDCDDGMPRADRPPSGRPNIERSLNSGELYGRSAPLACSR